MGWWSGDGGSQRPYFLNARCAFGRGMNCGAVTLSSEARHRCLGEGIKAGAVMHGRPCPVRTVFSTSDKWARCR